MSLQTLRSCGLFDNTGPKPKVKEDDFEELLSTQGFASRPDKKEPRTIAEMRREEMTRDMDPLKLQVSVRFRVTVRRSEAEFNKSPSLSSRRRSWTGSKGRSATSGP